MRPGLAEVLFWAVALCVALVLCLVMMAVSLWSRPADPETDLVSDEYVAAQIGTYLEVPLEGNMDGLNYKDQMALYYLQKAAKVVDDLFWRQYLLNNKEIYNSLIGQRDYYESLAGGASSDEKKYKQLSNLVEYYNINTGPYEVLVDYNPFLAPTSLMDFPAERKKGAEYYPDDMSQEEWNDYLNAANDAERKCAQSSVSVIKRSSEEGSVNGLKCTWYSDEYAEYLSQVHDYLLLASDYTEDESMKEFLVQRAQSCLDNSYIASDETWVNVNQYTAFDITIGPYETYMDGVNGIKASWEAYLGITKVDETRNVSTYSRYLNELQKNLPGNSVAYNSAAAELGSQVKIIDLIYSSGEAKQASQTLAYNLPNLPTESNKYRQIMLYNVQQAKFNNILKPIASIINDMSVDEVENVISFETNFQHTISHEFSHALGPTKTENSEDINTALGEYYSAFEEAKADIGAMWSVGYLSKNQRPCTAEEEDDPSIACGYAIQCNNSNFKDNSNGLPDCEDYKDKFFTTYLGDIIRTLRFGISEAHGQAVASYLNNLIDEEAITINGTTLTCDTDKMVSAAGNIFGFLLDTEYNGDRETAKQWLTKYGFIRDEIQKILDEVAADESIPVDIRPQYKEMNMPKYTEQ